MFFLMMLLVVGGPGDNHSQDSHSELLSFVLKDLEEDLAQYVDRRGTICLSQKLPLTTRKPDVTKMSVCGLGEQHVIQTMRREPQ